MAPRGLMGQIFSVLAVPHLEPLAVDGVLGRCTRHTGGSPPGAGRLPLAGRGRTAVAIVGAGSVCDAGLSAACVLGLSGLSSVRWNSGCLSGCPGYQRVKTPRRVKGRVPRAARGSVASGLSWKWDASPRGERWATRTPLTLAVFPGVPGVTFALPNIFIFIDFSVPQVSEWHRLLLHSSLAGQIIPVFSRWSFRRVGWGWVRKVQRALPFSGALSGLSTCDPGLQGGRDPSALHHTPISTVTQCGRCGYVSRDPQAVALNSVGYTSRSLPITPHSSLKKNKQAQEEWKGRGRAGVGGWLAVSSLFVEHGCGAGLRSGGHPLGR